MWCVVLTDITDIVFSVAKNSPGSGKSRIVPFHASALIGNPLCSRSLLPTSDDYKVEM